MIKKHKFDIIVVFAVIALGVSLFLAISHFLRYTVPCDITGGCEAVLNSKYAQIYGVPLSVLGVVYFTGVIVSALLANHYRSWEKFLTMLLGVGAVAALSFLSIQFFVLKKVCQYCLAADLISLALFMLDLNIERKNPTD